MLQVQHHLSGRHLCSPCSGLVRSSRRLPIQDDVLTVLKAGSVHGSKGRPSGACAGWVRALEHVAEAAAGLLHDEALLRGTKETVVQTCPANHLDNVRVRRQRAQHLPLLLQVLLCLRARLIGLKGPGHFGGHPEAHCDRFHKGPAA